MSSVQYVQTLLGSGLNFPSGVAVDAQGDVFIADENNARLLELTPTPNAGYVQNTIATFPGQQPWGVTVDVNGAVYVTQENGGTNGGEDGVVFRFERDTSTGLWFQATIPTTGLSLPQQIAVDKNLNIYVCNFGGDSITKLTASVTKPITYTQSTISSITGLSVPSGIGVDLSGNLYIADTGHGHLLLAKPGSGGSYTVSTIDSSLGMPVSVAVVGSAQVYVTDVSSNELIRETESGGTWSKTVISTGTLSSPEAVALDSGHNVYVANSLDNAVLKVVGSVSGPNFGQVAVGAASPTMTIQFKFDTGGTVGKPQFLTAGGTGGLDFGPVTSSGSCAAETYATGATCTVAISFKPQYPGVRAGAVVLPSSPGGPAATAYLQGTGLGPRINFQPGASKVALHDTSRMADLGGAIGLDDGGNFAYSDAGLNAVYLGTTSIGSRLKGPTDVAVDAAGQIYILDAGNNRILKETSGTSGYAQSVVVSDTIASSTLIGLAVDAIGNVFYIESAKSTGSEVYTIELAAPQSNGTYSISKFSPKTSTGTAATLTAPTEMALDAWDNLYIVENTSNTVLKETLTAGTYVQTTLTNSNIANPKGIAVDALGNVYISDWSLNQIMKETLSYKASTGAATYTESQLPIAGLTYLSHPAGMAVSGSGTLYIANANTDSMLGFWYYSAPAVEFPSTQQNTSSSETVTVANAGNQALTFPIPTSGDEPEPDHGLHPERQRHGGVHAIDNWFEQGSDTGASGKLRTDDRVHADGAGAGYRSTGAGR